MYVSNIIDFLSIVLIVNQKYARVHRKSDLPSLVERCGNQISKGASFHFTAFLQRVQVHLEFHPRIECLAVGSESGDTHEAALVDLEDSLEVAVDCHELR